jgi:exodeoxyribonuclease VII small subunit
MSTNLDEKIEDMSFEDAMKRLQDIVNKLESGQEKLEDAINLYQFGNKLKLHCEQKLDIAKAKIEKITNVNNGEVTTEPL